MHFGDFFRGGAPRRRENHAFPKVFGHFGLWPWPASLGSGPGQPAMALAPALALALAQE